MEKPDLRLFGDGVALYWLPKFHVSYQPLSNYGTYFFAADFLELSADARSREILGDFTIWREQQSGARDIPTETLYVTYIDRQNRSIGAAAPCRESQNNLHKKSPLLQRDRAMLYVSSNLATQL